MVRRLNSTLVGNKIYRKGDKLTFTLYNQLFDQLIESTSEEVETVIETTIDSLGYA